MKYVTFKYLLSAILFFSGSLMVSQVSDVDRLEGRVMGAGGPIGDSEVTLWETTSEAPRRISETRTNSNGSFELSFTDKNAETGVFYLIARGGVAKDGGEPNPAITLMATLGKELPERVTVNELTTIASVYTAAQFLHEGALRGNATGLQIAAGNVPNMVDLQTGSHGPVIINALNGPRTTTLARFNTLGALLSACISGKPGGCDKLFEATTTPDGSTPTNMLEAIHNIARFPGHNTTKLFSLFEELNPVPDGKRYRDVAFKPYLFYAPSAWTLSLVYAGGGYYAVGGAAIDVEGNFWTNNNWMPGSQTTIYHQFGGGEGKFAPSGKPLSPMITGFTGGGIDSPGWGIAFSADDKVWVTNLIGRTISVLDRKTGKALSPEGGYNFDGKLGQMQGVLVAPNGDVWAVDNEKNQIVHIPGGDISKGRILGRTVDGKPVDGTLQVKGPFGIAIDQQNRIWITNSASNTVTRFPAGHPEQAEEFTVGYSPHAIAIDSKGNAWIGNLIGHPDTEEKLALVKQKLEGKFEAWEGSMTADDVAANMWADLWGIINEYPGGDISMITPDGKINGPFNAEGAITGPWGIAIDGNDNVWVASSTSSSITQLAGVRPETRPQGLKTGDPITPQAGYIGGLQVIAPIAVDPAGNVWVGNGFHDTEAGFSKIPPEASSTQFGAHTIVVFFGVAKPVKTPLIGPVRRF